MRRFTTYVSRFVFVKNKPFAPPKGGSLASRDVKMKTKLSNPPTPWEKMLVFSIALSVVMVALLTLLLKTSDGRSALFLISSSLLVFIIYWFRTKDKKILYLSLFGIVFGVVELVADALCVHYTKTLDYSVAKSPMIWLSPWWMPLSWMVVAMQIGGIGDAMMTRFGSIKGAVLTAVLGAINIPFYEEMANYLHLWAYTNCLRFLHTPYYIVVAELIIALALAPAARYALQGVKPALIAGVIGGIATIIGGLVGYGLVEVIIGGRWPL
jgi:hypothetical protein